MELGPRGTLRTPARPSPTFPQLRQWCRRRSSVKEERQAEHWLHVLSGTHSGSRQAPAGQNTSVKAPHPVPHHHAGPRNIPGPLPGPTLLGVLWLLR